jgi:hypothetical protein
MNFMEKMIGILFVCLFLISVVVAEDPIDEECAEGCLTEFLDDDMCDEECNNSICNWDGGDCESEEAPTGGNWGDVNTGQTTTGNTSANASTNNNPSTDNSVSTPVTQPANTEKTGTFTINFYIALGFGLIGLLILTYIIYSFMKSPKDNWKKKRRNS